MSAFDDGIDTAVPPWVWTVRDINLLEYDGQIDGYISVKVTIIDGDVGDFVIELPLSHEYVPYLLAEGAGVVCRQPGLPGVTASGPVTQEQTVFQKVQDGVDTVTFTGPLDGVILASDVAYADPTHTLNDVAGNNVVSGHVDARTGNAEDVLLGYIADNIGATALAGRDRSPFLTIPTSLGRGTTGSYQANFTQLLDIAKTICGTGGITWRITQDTPGTLALAIREREDVSADVVFSRAEGSIDSATYTRAAPTVTQAIAVSDDGSTRTFATVTDAAAEALWGFRFVTMVDGDTAVIADLTQAAGDAIAAAIEQASAILTPVLLPGAPVLGVDFNLGDTVTAVDDAGNSIIDRLVQIDYEHTAGSTPQFTPSIGISQTDLTSALVPIIRAINAALRALKRR